MKYFEVIFSISAPATAFQDVSDIVAALAGNAGFESFEETDGGLKGYVQQQLFDDDTLSQLLSTIPFPDATVTYTVKEAEYRDWNTQWEHEGFDPIRVGEHLIICDARKTLPTLQNEGNIVKIEAKQAFGTGNHETTRMMAETLMSLPLEGKSVLDCGTGTGILAIVALLYGASRAIGYDIDEWSVANAQHNVQLNHVEARFEAILGDATVIDSLQKNSFDIVMANINRNILLNDLPRFCQALRPDGFLLLSGFYSDDVPLLVDKAASLGLKLNAEHYEGDWACLEFIVHNS